MRRLLVLLASLLTVVATTAFTWPTDHGDARRSGWYTRQTAFRHFALAFSHRLDGAVYGSPLVLGTRVIVATENNSVYSFNATTGKLLWYSHLRTPVRRATLPCGNIDPLGITGTPVHDANNLIFVIVETPDARSVARHEIVGLSALTGHVYVHRRIEVPHTDPKAQQQRAALADDGRGNIFAAFGGLAGDCGNYRGAVASFKASGAPGEHWYVVPTAREAGIWAAGGPIVAADGTVYVSTGNGAATSAPYDFSDSVTRLRWDMVRLDNFAPSSWASDNAADLDLGSISPVLVDNGFILQLGKSGEGYVLRSSHLGGIGGQVYRAPLCSAFGVAAFAHNYVYLPCTGGLTRVLVGNTGVFTRLWTNSTVNGSPVVGGNTVYSLGNGRLYAISSTTGATISSIAVGATTRFATPAQGPGLLYVGTTTGIVAVRVG